MKQKDKEWIDVMRSALRDAELPPPAGGWERLRRELGEAAPKPEAPVRTASRGSVWRIHWPRIAAAAAAVLISVVAGELLLRPDKALENDGTVIASAGDGGTAADIPQRAESESVQEVLAPGVGLLAERAARMSSSKPRQALHAAALTQRDALTGSGNGAPGRDAAGNGQPADRVAEDRPAAKASAAPSEKAAEKTSEKTRNGGRTLAGSSSRRTAFDEPFVAYTRPRRKASFSFFAGGGVSGGGDGTLGAQPMYSSVSNDISSVVGNGNNMAPLKRNDYGESSFRHHQALSFGLSVRKEFAYGLSLESGVNYTLLRSDVRARYSSDDISQKLHFIGVPLRLNWQFLERGRFTLYAGAGGMVEKCISAKFGSKTLEEPGVQWSALAAVGAQFRLGDMVGLYFEPEGAYYFTETDLRTSRTDSPLTLTLRLGVRLSF